MRKHNPTLFKHLAGISEEQEKQCLQKWRQNSDFLRFLKINISKLCHMILIFFSRVACNSAAFDLVYMCVTYIFFTIVIIHSLNLSFAQKFCSSAHFGGHFE